MTDPAQIARDAARDTVRAQFGDVCGPALREIADTAKSNAAKVGEMAQAVARVEVTLSSVVKAQEDTSASLRRIVVGNGGKGLDVRLTGLERDVGSLTEARNAMRSGLQGALWGGAMRIVIIVAVMVLGLATTAFVVRESQANIKAEVLQAVQDVVQQAPPSVGTP